MRILGTYKIVYDNGVQQIKNLVSHEDWLSTKDRKDWKKVQLELFGEAWFTDQSPLFEAISTGVLDLLEQQGGKIPCTLEKQNK